MLSRNILICILCSGIFVSCMDSKVDFNTEVRPILTSKCLSCHGGVKKNGGFSLLSKEQALATLQSGNLAIIPGNAQASELIKRVTHSDPEMRMPYKKPPLSIEEIDILTKWIEQGADFDSHWSFSSLSETPNTENLPQWGNNAIDGFIFSKLEENNLEPSPEASPETLLRRVALDLTGLPAPESISQAFLSAKADETYEALVDNLLNSQAYGEKWASLWLDLARYADTQGYEKDPHREIWSYRDYVIRAFNQDKPYNQFLLEQLAGDMLPNASEESIIATAFHRNTMTNTEGGTDNEEFRTVAVIDRVNTTYEAILGITMACVQCHDHPYDPIKQEDYYRSFAFFNTQQDNDLDSDIPLYSLYPVNQRDSIIRLVEKYTGTTFHRENQNFNLAVAESSFPYLFFGNAQNITGATANNDHSTGHFENIAEIAFGNFEFNGEDKVQVNYQLNKPLRFVLEIDNNEVAVATLSGKDVNQELIKTLNVPKGIHGRHLVSVKVNTESPWQPWDRGKLKSLLFIKGENTGRKDSLIIALSGIRKTSVPVMLEQRDSLRNTYIFEKGNWTAHGKKVPPGIPGIFNPGEKTHSNRLEFARWVANKENPLTARVMVNRVWEQLFGKGLVSTLSDFGAIGEVPSHPQLLDWLSFQFMNEWNWSVKRLVKEIVMSDTYRQSSKISREQLEADPENRWLSRGPRFRLSAEQVRDQMLAVSNLLSHKMYGPSVMPPQPPNIWSVVYSGAQWKESTGEDRYRRAIYTYWRRTSPYPSMISFDTPSREFCVSQRVRTNTPLQALVMLNDTVSMEAAQHLAKIAQNAPDNTDVKNKILYMYKKATGSAPDTEELEILFHLYNQSLEEFKAGKSQPEKFIFTKTNHTDTGFSALTIVANTILNLDAFVMKY